MSRDGPVPGRAAAIGAAGRRRGRRRPGVVLAAALAVALLAAAPPLRAAPLVADLSQHLVAITTGFTGTEVLLFGAVDEPGDVVVIVRGPDREIVMHRKSRVLGVWVNTAQMTFARAPSFYAVASSRPIAEVAPPALLARHEMGVEHLRLELPRAKASPNVATEWRQGLIRNQQSLGLYQTEVSPITFLGNRLFRARIALPANVPTGSYQVEVFLLRDGRVVTAQTTPLHVSKLGSEAVVYDFAYEHSALYGLIAIFVALMAGWLAHLAFRKT